MKFVSDDDIKRVDRRYLGPKGKLLIVRTTYRNWGIAVGVIVSVVFLWTFLGLPVDKWLIAIAAFGSLFLIVGIQRYLVDEVTIYSTAKTLYNEAQAPSEEHVGKPETVFLGMYVPIYKDGIPKTETTLQRRKFEADEKFDQKLRARFEKKRYVPYVES